MLSRYFRSDADIKEVQNFVMRNSDNIEVAVFSREFTQKFEKEVTSYLSEKVLIAYSPDLRGYVRTGYNNKVEKRKEAVRFYFERGEDTMISADREKSFEVKMYNKKSSTVKAQRITMKNGFIFLGDNMYKADEIKSIEEV